MVINRPRWAFAPVDAASLAAFRIFFGLLMFCAMARFASKGWIKELYLDPTYHFSYWGLDWIRPLGVVGTYSLFMGIGIAALVIALGWYTRLAALIFALLFSYVELIDKTTYLNHYYFITLASLWLCILPTDQVFSYSSRGHSRDRAFVPAWTLWALRMQVGLVYCFAGIAKINSDWLLHDQPLRLWLNSRSDMPLIGPLLSTPLAAFGASWAGMLFDLTAPFFLLWPRTRKYAFLAVIGFHVATFFLFPIGMFPWIMIASATIFFNPNWPRKLSLLPARALRAENSPRIQSRLTLITAILLLTSQVIIPIRSLFHPGDSRWNERGFRFSWRVMLVEKLGSVTFTVLDDQGLRSEIDPATYLSPLQNRMMAYAPDMIRQCAQWIAEDLQGKGKRPVAIYADARVTLNGRPSRVLIDPDANLLHEQAPTWIKDF